MGAAEDGSQRAAKPLGLREAHFLLQERRERAELDIGHAHVPGAGDVGHQLRLAAWQGGNGADRDDFALGEGQVVPGEDVAEQMGLQIEVGLRGEGIGERLAADEFRLHLGALFQRIVVLRQRVGLAAFLHAKACLRALFNNLLQGAQRVQRAREARVCIQMRQGLLGFAHGQSLFKSFVQGLLQPVDISFRLVGRNGRERLLFLRQCHIILCKK